MNPEDDDSVESVAADADAVPEESGDAMAPLTVAAEESIGADPDTDAADPETVADDDAGADAEDISDAGAADVSSPEESAADDAEADTPDDDEASADVSFDGDRPLVEELQYQAARPRAGTSEESETAEDARFTSVAEARAVVEGLLFSSNEPLSVARLSKLMSNLHPKTVRGLLLELQWEYDNRGGALQVVEIAGGYQMSTRPSLAPWMFRLHKLKRRSPLSPATLETLAIVAYRQPITKGEIEGIRGVETGAPLRTLQELNLIEASGRREVVGRPQLYVTTEQFLKVFGLKSLADLPSISELKSRFAEDQKLKPSVAAAEPKPESEAQAPAGADAGSETDAEADSTSASETEAQPGSAALDVAEESISAEAAQQHPGADEATAETETATEPAAEGELQDLPEGETAENEPDLIEDDAPEDSL